MLNVFKIFLIFLGGVLIGFGMGITAVNFLILEGVNYWLLFIASLVLGGFLLALGVIIRKKSPASKKKEIKEVVSTEQKINEEKEINNL